MQSIKCPVNVTTRYGLNFKQLVEAEHILGIKCNCSGLTDFLKDAARINNTANKRHNIQCSDYYILKDAKGNEFYILVDDVNWQLYDQLPNELLVIVLSS